MKTPAYIFKNSFEIYHLRVRVPERLRPIIGKREIKKSLKTGNLREALQKSRRLVTLILEEFDRMSLKDILNNPLNASLMIKSCIRRPDGTVELTGIETDPEHPEAENAVLEHLLKSIQPPATTPAAATDLEPITLKELIEKYLGKIIS
jgi:hypothetical protein